MPTHSCVQKVSARTKLFGCVNVELVCAGGIVRAVVETLASVHMITPV